MKRPFQNAYTCNCSCLFRSLADVLVLSQNISSGDVAPEPANKVPRATETYIISPGFLLSFTHARCPAPSRPLLCCRSRKELIQSARHPSFHWLFFLLRSARVGRNVLSYQIWHAAEPCFSLLHLFSQQFTHARPESPKLQRIHCALRVQTYLLPTLIRIIYTAKLSNSLVP